MNKPKISIITATHYRPDLLARCIKSVQSQTMTDYEHIIFSDHCPKAAQVYEYFKDDKRIRFFENPKEHVPNHGAFVMWETTMLFYQTTPNTCIMDF